MKSITSIFILLLFSTLGWAQPDNDDCANAELLEVGNGLCNSIYGTTVDAISLEDPTTCSAADPDDAVWYSFVATNAVQYLNVDVYSSTIAVEIYTGTCGNLTPFDCIGYDQISQGVVTLTGFTPSTTYYLRAFDEATNSGGTEFYLCVFGPPTNDECANAITLTPDPDGPDCFGAEQYTTNGASGPGNTGCGGYDDSDDDDVWFQFTATQRSHKINMYFASSVCGWLVELRSGACGSSALIECNYINTFCDYSLGEIIYTDFTPGATYYIRLYTQDQGNSGNFNICVGSFLPAANEECADAIPLEIGEQYCGNSEVGNIASATASNLAGNCGGAPYYDLWYQFTATEVSHTVELYSTFNSMDDAILEAFSGSCGSLNPIACLTINPGNTESLSLNGLIIGETYSLRVMDANGTGSFIDFSICISTPIANDECSGAIEVFTVNGITCSDPTEGSVTNSTPSDPPQCDGGPAGDVWYKFTATHTTHAISYSSINGIQPVFEVFEGGCGGTSIACCGGYNPSSNCESTGLLRLTGLTIGEVYYFRVFSYYNYNGAFEFCIFAPPDNDLCSNPVVLPVGSTSGACTPVSATTLGATGPGNLFCSGYDDDDVWFQFTLPADATSISVSLVPEPGLALAADVYQDCNIGLGCLNANNVFSGLTPNQTYYLRVYAQPQNGPPNSQGNFTVCIRGFDKYESVTSGNWEDGSTWNVGVVPSASSEVVIKSGHSVSINNNQSCSGLNIESSATMILNGPLLNSGELLNYGTIEWMAGSFQGAGNITNEGTININGGYSHMLKSNITNNGFIHWFQGNISISGTGQTITNTGEFNIILIGGVCYAQIENSGLIQIETGANIPLNNSLANQSGGTINLKVGATLNVNANITQSGDFVVNGTLNFNSGIHLINDANSFSGTGTIVLNGEVTFNSSGEWHPSIGNLTHNGILKGSISLTIPVGTTWDWHNGSFELASVITNNGILNISDANSYHDTDSDIINNGTINWPDGDIDFNFGGQILTNNTSGLFYILHIDGYDNFNMELINKGEILMVDESGLYIGMLDNQISGTFFIESGSDLHVRGFVQSGVFTINGKLTLDANAVPAEVHINSADGMSGVGELFFAEPIEINSITNWQPSVATVWQNADLIGSTGLTIPVGTTWNWKYGSFELLSPITNNGIMNLTDYPGIYQHNTDSDIINNGFFNWNYGFIDENQGGQKLINAPTGVLTFNENFQGFIGECFMPIENSGILQKTGGSSFTNIRGSYIGYPGSCIYVTYETLSFTDIFNNSGTIKGSGDVNISNANTINFGLISPGSSPGILTTTGDYSNNGNDLIIEIGGTIVGTEYDRFVVTGTANLSGGNINLSLYNGFTPQVGHSFTILDAQSLTGTFASPTDPFVFAGLNWNIIYDQAGGTIVLNAESVLPIELVDFQAKTQTDHTTLLTWHTASEANNEGFHIEKSTDGRQFENIGFVAGAGNSLEDKSYSFLDEKFLASAYYRLRQVDFDGQANLSKTIFLEKPPTFLLSAFPNPAHDVLQFKFDVDSKQPLLLTLSDLTGKAVYSTLIKDNQKEVETIQVGHLAPGTYFLKIGSLDTGLTERLKLIIY